MQPDTLTLIRTTSCQAVATTLAGIGLLSLSNGAFAATSGSNSIIAQRFVAEQMLATDLQVLAVRTQMNDLRKRLGNIRTTGKESGVWVRANGGNFSGEAKFDGDFTLLQLGVDTLPAAGYPRLGAAFTYQATEAFNAFALADSDAYSLAGYAVWTLDNGAFIDIIGRVANVDINLAASGGQTSLEQDLYSLSLEGGHRFGFAGTFFLEPGFEFTYTYLKGDDYTLAGVKRMVDDIDSVIARFGFTFGKSCPSGFGDMYIRAAALHEFLGDTKMKMGSGKLERNGEDAWFEYGIGADFNLNRRTYIYLDLERTAGASIDEDWRANLGVRFNY